MDTNSIATALQYLAGNCDFARKQDGAGFNKFDAGFGHSLAEFTAAGGTLSANQESKALEMLRKYSKQLADAGITLPDKVNGNGENKPTVTLSNQLIMVKFDGKPAPEMLELVRSLPERRWNPDLPGKPWVIPAKYVKQIIKALDGKAEIGQDVLDFAAWVEDHKNDLAKPEVAKPVQQPVAQQQPQSQRSSVKVEMTDKGIVLSFPYNADLVAWVKALPERKYNPDNKTWVIPERYADKILAKFPDATGKEKLQTMVSGMAERAEISRAATSDFDVPGMKLPLLPFQRAGVEFIEKAGGRAILGDSMGLGKTVQAIAYLQLHPEFRPAVIIVPASLKLNWKREIGRFLGTGEKVTILSGQKAHDLDLYGSTIFVINYDVLGYWADKIVNSNPGVIIFDEAHAVKNMTSARSKASMKISKSCERVICMSGTPITNRPAELWPLLNIVAPSAWPKFFPFAVKFCGARQEKITVRGKTRVVWNFSGATNLLELHNAIKPWVIRRLKDDVLKELPEKQHATVIVEFDETQRERYNAIISGAIDVIKNSSAKGSTEIIAEIEKAKQATVYAKLPASIEWIENFLNSDEKLVVFCTHQFAIDALMEKFGKVAVKVTGEVTGEDRQKAVDAFQQNEKVRLFVGNIRAASEGITLTAASNVAFLEYPWVPSSVLQAIDRTHRIGQTKSVTAWYLVANGTIEEEIVELLKKKMRVISKVIDGQEGSLEIMGEVISILKGGS